MAARRAKVGVTPKKNDCEKSMIVNCESQKETDRADYLKGQAKRFAAKIGIGETDQVSISIARLEKSSDSEKGLGPKIEIDMGR